MSAITMPWSNVNSLQGRILNSGLEFSSPIYELPNVPQRRMCFLHHFTSDELAETSTLPGNAAIHPSIPADWRWDTTMPTVANSPKNTNQNQNKAQT